MSDRSIELEVEVVGTPEEVWDTIATGPGISTWFVPAEVEGRVGGKMALDFGPGMGVQAGEVTAWEPTRRLVYASVGSAGHQLAYEWLIEAKTGGTCIVRLVNSGFLDDAEWQAEYNGTYEGWKLFLHNMQLTRRNFPGQRCASALINGTSAHSNDEAWDTLSRGLGLPAEPRTGDHLALTGAGVPPLAGTIERFEKRLLTLLLDTPQPGIAFVGLEGSGPTLFVSVYLYLYGPDAAATLARDEPAWRTWMERTFPPVAAPA